MEEPFTNKTIDTLTLPRFEDVQLTPLHPSYLKVIWFNIALVFGSIAVAAGLGFYYINELQPYRLAISGAYIVVVLFTIIINVLNFKTRGFAFREHDVIYRNGVVSVNTTIIPYSRVQHVAVHEGIIARWLDLATVEVFTAGGVGGDIKIPGLEKIHATAIKQLLVGKIDSKQEQGEEDLYSKATGGQLPLEEEENDDEGKQY